MHRVLSLALIAVALSLTATKAGAAIITYEAVLAGANEAPPNASPGTGFAIVTLDDVAQTLRVQVTFSGLTAPNTAAHIHCCTAVPEVGTAGVATVTPTFTLFPAGTSGTYDFTYNLLTAGSFNPAFVTAQGGLDAARAVLLAGLAADRAYLNIHTSTFPGGEIRGFLTPAAVPEPVSLSLVGLGLAGVALRRRWRV